MIELIVLGIEVLVFHFLHSEFGFLRVYLLHYVGRKSVKIIFNGISTSILEYLMTKESNSGRMKFCEALFRISYAS